MEEEKDNTEIYELGYHILPTVTERDVPAEVSEIKAVISEARGAIISEGAAQSRGLSYEISKKMETKTLKFNRAYFGWLKFETLKEDIGDIKSKVESMPNILRFIIVKTVRENTMHTPKAPVFSKTETIDRVAPRGGTDRKEKISEEEIDKSIDELLVS